MGKHRHGGRGHVQTQRPAAPTGRVAESPAEGERVGHPRVARWFSDGSECGAQIGFTVRSHCHPFYSQMFRTSVYIVSVVLTYVKFYVLQKYT